MFEMVFIHPSAASEVENVRGQLLRQGFLGTGYIASSLETEGIKCKIVNMQLDDVSVNNIIELGRV